MNSLKIKSFRDLEIWQLSILLATKVYAVTEVLPKEEKFGLSSQMRRASVSIASNIAEGHNRKKLGEYLHSLSLALGSLAELETQIELAARLSFFSQAETNLLL